MDPVLDSDSDSDFREAIGKKNGPPIAKIGQLNAKIGQPNDRNGHPNADSAGATQSKGWFFQSMQKQQKQQERQQQQQQQQKQHQPHLGLNFDFRFGLLRSVLASSTSSVLARF